MKVAPLKLDKELAERLMIAQYPALAKSHADLLAVLKRMERRVSCFGNSRGAGKDWFDWSDDGADRAMIEQARAAIAKAKETP